MTFTLATYNILASAYIKPEWFPNTDLALLDARVRRPKKSFARRDTLRI